MSCLTVREYPGGVTERKSLEETLKKVIVYTLDSREHWSGFVYCSISDLVNDQLMQEDASPVPPSAYAKIRLLHILIRSILFDDKQDKETL